MRSDERGLKLSAANEDAVRHLDAALSAYCGLRRDTGDHLKRALATDPRFAMAHILRGNFMMLFGKREMVPRAAQALAAAEAGLASGFWGVLRFGMLSSSNQAAA